LDHRAPPLFSASCPCQCRHGCFPPSPSLFNPQAAGAFCNTEQYQMTATRNGFAHPGKYPEHELACVVRYLQLRFQRVLKYAREPSDPGHRKAPSIRGYELRDFVVVPPEAWQCEQCECVRMEEAAYDFAIWTCKRQWKLFAGKALNLSGYAGMVAQTDRMEPAP